MSTLKICDNCGKGTGEAPNTAGFPALFGGVQRPVELEVRISEEEDTHYCNQCVRKAVRAALLRIPADVPGWERCREWLAKWDAGRSPSVEELVGALRFLLGVDPSQICGDEFMLGQKFRQPEGEA